jgi:HSP20 family protein
MAQEKQTDPRKTGREMERSEHEVPARRYPSRSSFMRRMMDDFERMFDEPFFGSLMTTRGPAIDVFERGNDLVVRADLPGYKKDDIELEVTGEGVLIQGQRTSDREEKDGGYYRRERTYGSFRRLIPLPEGIDDQSVRAEMKNGVLEICFTLPAQRTERKKIQITGEETTTGTKKSVH